MAAAAAETGSDAFGEAFADALARSLVPGDANVHAMVAAFGAPAAAASTDSAPYASFVDAHALVSR